MPCLQPDAVSCLVVGTESGRVLILNSAGTAVTRNVWLGVTPACLAVHGELEVGYRITVAGRDGKVYCIRCAAARGESALPALAQLTPWGAVHAPQQTLWADGAVEGSRRGQGRGARGAAHRMPRCAPLRGAGGRRNGELQQTIIQLEAPAVGLVHLANNSILVGCMNDAVHCYKPNGHKSYTIYTPSPILVVQKVELQASRMTRGLLLALRNGEQQVLWCLLGGVLWGEEGRGRARRH